MKTNIKKLAHTILLISILFLGMFSIGTQIASAQNQSTDYTVLAPLPGTTETTGCTDSSGDSLQGQCATLGTYLPGIFNLSIGIAAIMAFVLLTIYGFEYMLTDIPAVKVNVKDQLSNVAFGGGLILFAWLILNTVNPALVNGTLSLTTPQINAPASLTTTGGAGTGTTSGGAGVVGYVNTCSDPNSPTCISETTDRSVLATDSNITVQSACNGAQQSGCTNLANIPTTDMQTTINLQQQCGCSISVTGGTEHQASNTLDMSSSSGLNTFLTGSGTISTPPSAPISKTINGQPVTFTYESAGQQSNLATGGTVTATGNHWHVTFPSQ